MYFDTQTKPSAPHAGAGAVAQLPLERRRIVIAERDPRTRERLRHTLFELGMDIAGLAGDGQEAVQMACLLAPDFVLLDESLPILGALDAALAMHIATPEVAPILMTERQGPAQLREAMQNGVRDVIGKPLDSAELYDSLKRLSDIHMSHQSDAFKALLDPTKLPSVYCVTGGKGGVGKTMVATNLALALCDTREKTILIDLYTQFGDVASALNMKPQRTLAELSPIVDDIDSALLASYTQVHSSGLRVLFGSDSPLPLDAITPACLDRLIQVLKREYKYVVFDTPPYLHATTLHALSLANAVLLVCNLFDYTTIADSKQLFDTLNGAYVSSDRLKLIVNRVSAQNKFQLTDVEETFGQEVFAQIPNDPKVVALLNTGYPSHDTISGTPLGAAVCNLREALVNPIGGRATQLTGAEAAKRTRTRGFLGGLKLMVSRS
ncbi:MAG TPA: AAA family ATPase [Armatimonadota bacterium]|jgi:pilus assembly protein CpaE